MIPLMNLVHNKIDKSIPRDLCRRSCTKLIQYGPRDLCPAQTPKSQQNFH